MDISSSESDAKEKSATPEEKSPTISNPLLTSTLASSQDKQSSQTLPNKGQKTNTTSTRLRPFSDERPVRLKKRPQSKQPKPSLGVPRKWETGPKKKSPVPLWVRQFIPSSKQVWNPEINEGIMIFPYPYYKSPTKSVPGYAAARYHLVDGEIEWMPRYIHRKGQKTKVTFDLFYIETSLVESVISALQSLAGCSMPTREELRTQGQQSAGKIREDETKKRIMKFRL